MKGFGTGLLLVGFLALVVWYNVSIWQECRQTNSWGYCMKVLSR